MTKTIDYYNDNAVEYANSTLNVDVSEQITIFLDKIEFGGKILDAGCGSGRDLKTFGDLGFKAIGLEPSEELAKIAHKNSGMPVTCKSFKDIDQKNEFDGVWCMASLLHLNKDELRDTLMRIGDSLKPDGKFYASFKTGEGESYDNKGRFFSYTSKEELQELFKSVEKFKNIIIDYSSDKLGRQDTQWLNVHATSDNPKLELKKRITIKPN